MRRLRLLTAGESHGPAISGVLEGLPAGLDTRLGAGGCGLSAGEAQLLALTHLFQHGSCTMRELARARGQTKG